MLTILAVAGVAGFSYAFPLAVTIVALLAIVTLSYQQIIHAYPDGGGAYTVARDNLGEMPAQVAAGALLADYVLTVAVSVSAGVAQLASAFPPLLEHRVPVAIALLVVIMVVNLRGVKESGMIFAIPSYFFIVLMVLMVGFGFARAIFQGRGLLYHAVIGATTVILVLAANTAFNGFPRLSALQAEDGFLPRQLTYRGSRLVYSRGIIALALMASLLIWIFHASVTALIPLYAIGVFLSFTLAQVGMTRRWWKVGHLAPGTETQERGSLLRHDPRWRLKLVSNGLGGAATALVTVVFAVTKFREGAWVVILVIPALVALFMGINRHYIELRRRLSLDEYGAPPRVLRHRVILPISGVHRGTVAALRYARALSHDITAVHVSVDEEDTRRLEEKWGLWGNGVRLVTLPSPYRLLMEPLLEYIEQIADLRQSNETLTIVVPQFVARKWWHNLLHAQTAVLLRLALLYRPGIVITNVPYLMAEDGDEPSTPESPRLRTTS